MKKDSVTVLMDNGFSKEDIEKIEGASTKLLKTCLRFACDLPFVTFYTKLGIPQEKITLLLIGYRQPATIKLYKGYHDKPTALADLLKKNLMTLENLWDILTSRDKFNHLFADALKGMRAHSKPENVLKTSQTNPKKFLDCQHKIFKPTHFFIDQGSPNNKRSFEQKNDISSSKKQKTDQATNNTLPPCKDLIKEVDNITNRRNKF